MPRSPAKAIAATYTGAASLAPQPKRARPINRLVSRRYVLDTRRLLVLILDTFATTKMTGDGPLRREAAAKAVQRTSRSLSFPATLSCICC